MIRSRAADESPKDKMLDAIDLEARPIGEADTDAHLMWRLRGRDEQALAALYDRHAGVAFGLAVRMLRDRASAEEVVQDAFLNLWRRAAAYAPDRASVRSWLLVMVRSRAIDRLRPASARARSVPLEEEPQLRALSDTWRAVADSARREAVRSALVQLPSEQGEILQWAYYSGLTQSEIAERSGLPIGTVKSRTRLGLERLRRLLGDSIAAEEPES
ncbi:MAG TPA: sigma-70 family RNA polymerase sigma factor [Candidatus Dormibacteraeota bacterium]